MTVVSFATSAPELIVSVQSAIDGFPDLALSNVIGSNIANLGLVLGITLLIAKIDVTKAENKAKNTWLSVNIVKLIKFNLFSCII